MTQGPWASAGACVLLVLAGCNEFSTEPLLTVGARHSCVLEEDGTLRCWGRRDWPVPADWVGGEDPHAVPPVDVPVAVRHASAGPTHTCAVTEGGDVWCWGEGDGLGLDHRRPAEPVITKIKSSFSHVRAARARTCGVTSGHKLWCWGQSSDTLGYDAEDEIDEDSDPAESGPVPLGEPVADVALGWMQTCALTTDGRVLCWGNYIGPARDAEEVTFSRPVVEIQAGGSHFCARLDGGSIRCWGQAAARQRGSGGGDDGCRDACPDDVGCCMTEVDVGGVAVALSVGDDHSCVRLDDGTARCWGNNGSGELGQGHVDPVGDDERPGQVPPIELDGDVLEIEAAWDARTCARLDDGTIRCWGRAMLEGTDGVVDCMVQVPNPSAGATCEPDTIPEFSCAAHSECCVGDDETPLGVEPIPM